MHEVSLAGNILQMVENARMREPFERVTLLRLQAGALVAVDIAALRFALESMAPGTCLEGAQIAIDEQAAMGWCARCSQSVAIFSRLDLCPLCEGACVQPTSGTDLTITDLRVQ